jgi:hypothetical protein
MSIIVSIDLRTQFEALKLLNAHASLRDSGSEMRGLCLARENMLHQTLILF